MPENGSSTPTAPGIRALRIGLPLIAAGLVAAACSSSGAGNSAGGSGGGGASSPASSAAGSSATSGGALKLTDGHLTDATGRTVYLWVADKGSKSTCAGACANVWPAVPASGTPSVGSGLMSSLLTKTTRSDGSTQLDYAGHPLYYFAADTTPGAAKGQGSDSFGAKWWELTATGKAVTTAATSSGSSSSSSSSSSGGSSSGGGGYGY